MPSTDRQEQFLELLAGCQSRVMACIYALIHNMQDTEDIYQEACLLMWQKFDDYQPGTQFVKWACRIAYLKVMAYLRQKPGNVRFDEEFVNQFAAWDASLPTDESCHRVQLLQLCMERLGQADRRLVELRYWESVSVVKIAAGLGRTPQSVCNSLGRIRGQLMACVELALSDEDRK